MKGQREREREIEGGEGERERCTEGSIILQTGLYLSSLTVTLVC